MIKALVVENEADISDLLAEQVKDKGCRVQKSGELAIPTSLATTEHPGLLKPKRPKIKRPTTITLRS